MPVIRLRISVVILINHNSAVQLPVLTCPTCVSACCKRLHECKSGRVHSPGGTHTSDNYTTGVLHMVREVKYVIYNMVLAWQKGCYTLLTKIERSPNGCGQWTVVVEAEWVMLRDHPMQCATCAKWVHRTEWCCMVCELHHSGVLQG